MYLQTMLDSVVAVNVEIMSLRHGGAVISVVASQQDGPVFNPWIG